MSKWIAEGAEEGTEEYVVYAGGTSNVSVDPGTGHLFVGAHLSKEVIEFNVSGSTATTEVSNTTTPGVLKSYQGVASDWATGNMYVTSNAGTKVEVYGPVTGTRPAEGNFGSAAEPTFTAPAAMAVDQTTGDVYVVDSETKTLYRYHEDGTPAPFTALSGEPDENAIDGKGGADKVTTGAEEILTSEGGLNGFTEVQVAVAPPGSANGTAGDIYVTDAENGRIVVFAPSGEYLGVKAISSYPCGVAVGPTGDVFVGSYEGTNEGVTKLEPSAPATFAQSAASPFGPGETCQVAAGYGPSAGSVFATEFNGAVSKWIAEGAEEGTEEYRRLRRRDEQRQRRPRHRPPLRRRPPQQRSHRVQRLRVHCDHRSLEYDDSGRPQVLSGRGVRLGHRQHVRDEQCRDQG